MASFARFDSRPALKRPVLVAGLPGVGSVGRIAVGLMVEQLNAERIARFYSTDLPNTVEANESCVTKAPCYGLWLVRCNKKDVIFLIGDHQATSIQGQMSLTEDIFRTVLKHDPSLVIAVGGCYVEEPAEEPRILGAVTDPGMKPLFTKSGVQFVPGEPKGGISGMNGALMTLCEAYGVNALCMMAETSGPFEDRKGAGAVAEALTRILGTRVDCSSLSEDKATEQEEDSREDQDPPYFG